MEHKHLYDNYIFTLHKRFNNKLNEIEAEHNFELGNEFEIAVCKILRSFLPGKYGVCRGFVVSKDGTKAGDDIIIFDQERFPTLRLLEKNDFSRLENIPIEAVYVYVEVKHTLNICADQSKCVQAKSIQQVREVKELLNRRDKVQLLDTDSYVKQENVLAIPEIGNPSYRNPSMCIILSRYVALEGKRLKNLDQISAAVRQGSLKLDSYSPDLIVAGESVVITPGLKTSMGKISQFIYDHQPNSYFYSQVLTEKAYGVFLARIGFAIDWVRLGKMPWGEILSDAQRGN